MRTQSRQWVSLLLRCIEFSLELPASFEHYWNFDSEWSKERVIELIARGRGC